jgi:hypothetical protein
MVVPTRVPGAPSGKGHAQARGMTWITGKGRRERELVPLPAVRKIATQRRPAPDRRGLGAPRRCARLLQCAAPGPSAREPAGAITRLPPGPADEERSLPSGPTAPSRRLSSAGSRRCRENARIWSRPTPGTLATMLIYRDELRSAGDAAAAR